MQLQVILWLHVEFYKQLSNCFPLFSVVAIPCYLPTSSVWMILFLCTLISIWCGHYFFTLATLKCVWCYRIVTLACIFIKDSDVEHLFMCLFPTYICLLVKCLFMCSSPFSNWIFF